VREASTGVEKQRYYNVGMLTQKKEHKWKSVLNEEEGEGVGDNSFVMKFKTPNAKEHKTSMTPSVCRRNYQ
jgi:hypothetical protein